MVAEKSKLGQVWLVCDDENRKHQADNYFEHFRFALFSISVISIHQIGLADAGLHYVCRSQSEWKVMFLVV
jgi:hypothetical protein